MREPQEKTINGRTYRVTPLAAGQGLGLLTLITKHIARGLENVTSLAALTEQAGKAIADVAAHLDEAHVDRLCKTLAGSAVFEVEPGSGKFVPLSAHFDNHFAAAYGELAQFLAFALEANYGSFFAMAQGAMAARAPAAPGASPKASA